MTARFTKAYLGHPVLEPVKKRAKCAIAYTERFGFRWELRRYSSVDGHPPLKAWRARSAHSWGAYNYWRAKAEDGVPAEVRDILNAMIDNLFEDQRRGS